MLVTDTTDAQGLVRANVRLGRSPGPATIKLSAPSLGLVDSATFTITTGATNAVRATNTDTALVFGATATLSGRVVDRAGNTRPEVVTLSISPGSAVMLNPATGVASAQSIGMGWVYFRFNNLVDSTSVRAVPPGRLAALVGSEIRMVNTDGSNVRTLATNVSGGLGASPRFDASGQRVSFQNGSLFIATSFSIVDTTGPVRRDYDETVGLNSILATRVLANGTVLALAQRTPERYSLWRVANDNTLTAIIAVPGLLSIQFSGDISPDGTQIAYAVPAPPGNPELRVLNTTTGAVSMLEPQITGPRWSRPGDRIAYIAADGLAIINANGTGRRLIATGRVIAPLTWSSDGAYIVATVEVPPNLLGLRVFRVSDGASVDLRFRSATGAIESYRYPDWR
ncbi:MAG: hypothetical protein H7Z40_20465 [Phycisphaerae bacterium]|nr:hypothetical protein [Gemmatimonadaceae bacterium]